MSNREIKSSDEIKAIEMNTLLFIREICENNDIRYFLTGGTLLGAVRHKGFIPWDDDIDICMPRPDYNRFIETVEKKMDKYITLNPSQCGYYYCYAKVVDSSTRLIETGVRPIDNLGVYVDVFPLDGMPDKKEVQDRHFKELSKIRRKLSLCAGGKQRIRKNMWKYLRGNIWYYTYTPEKLNRYQQEYISRAQMYSYHNSSIVIASGGAYRERDIFPKEWYGEGVPITFEGETFTAPTEYGNVLTQLYGDYMSLPAEEKRISRHSFRAYRKDDRHD